MVDIGLGVPSFEIGRTVVPWVDIKCVVPAGLVCEVLRVVWEVPLVDIGFGVSPIEVVPWVDFKCVVPGLEDVLGVVWEVPLVDVGLGVSLLDVGFAVVPCVDIRYVVLRLVWEVPLLDIGPGVSS